MALLDYCLKLNNFFINDYDEDIHTGDYTIKNGAIDLDFISKNQYNFLENIRNPSKINTFHEKQ